MMPWRLSELLAARPAFEAQREIILYLDFI